MLLVHGKLCGGVSSSEFSFFSASVSRLCSLLMVSFEVVFQVLSLVFPASVSRLCSLLMVSFVVVFQVLSLVFQIL